MYLGYLQNWLDYGHGLLIFLLLASLWLWNGSNLGFPGISWRTHGGNGLKFRMLMYLNHLQNWLVYGHSLLILLILAFFYLVKWVKFGVSVISWRTLSGNGLIYCMLMYLEHLKNWLVYGHSLLIFLIWAFFYLVKWVKFGVSGHFMENPFRKWPKILYADVSWPP